MSAALHSAGAAIAPRRRLEPEWMDDPRIDPELHGRALAGLARLNRLARVAEHFARPLVALARRRGVSTLRIVDAASGGGDNGRRLVRLLAARGVSVELLGLDLSPTAVLHCNRLAGAEAWPPGSRLTYQVRDVLAEGLPEGCDAILNALFAHHLSEAEAVRFLAQIAAAEPRLAIVHDLDAGLWGSALARLVPPVVTRSPVVRVDAVRSARAAFTRGQALELARLAGWAKPRVEKVFPARWHLCAEFP